MSGGWGQKTGEQSSLDRPGPYISLLTRWIRICNGGYPRGQYPFKPHSVQTHLANADCKSATRHVCKIEDSPERQQSRRPASMACLVVSDCPRDMPPAVLRNRRRPDSCSPRRLPVSSIPSRWSSCSSYSPRIIETPQIRPWNETPSKSTPVGVRTVLGTTGRWLRPVCQSCSTRFWGPKREGSRQPAEASSRTTSLRSLCLEAYRRCNQASFGER